MPNRRTDEDLLTPIPFTWPLGAVFWIVLVWAYWPESRILRAARRAERGKERALRDPSYRPLVVGQQVVLTVAVLLAVAAPSLAIRTHREALFVVGLII